MGDMQRYTIINLDDLLLFNIDSQLLEGPRVKPTNDSQEFRLIFRIKPMNNISTLMLLVANLANTK